MARSHVLVSHVFVGAFDEEPDEPDAFVTEWGARLAVLLDAYGIETSAEHVGDCILDEVQRANRGAAMGAVARLSESGTASLVVDHDVLQLRVLGPEADDELTWLERVPVALTRTVGPGALGAVLVLAREPAVPFTGEWPDRVSRALGGSASSALEGQCDGARFRELRIAGMPELLAYWFEDFRHEALVSTGLGSLPRLSTQLLKIGAYAPKRVWFRRVLDALREGRVQRELTLPLATEARRVFQNVRYARENAESALGRMNATGPWPTQCLRAHRDIIEDFQRLEAEMDAACLWGPLSSAHSFSDLVAPAGTAELIDPFGFGLSLLDTQVAAGADPARIVRSAIDTAEATAALLAGWAFDRMRQDGPADKKVKDLVGKLTWNLLITPVPTVPGGSRSEGGGPAFDWFTSILGEYRKAASSGDDGGLRDLLSDSRAEVFDTLRNQRNDDAHHSQANFAAVLEAFRQLDGLIRKHSPRLEAVAVVGVPDERCTKLTVIDMKGPVPPSLRPRREVAVELERRVSVGEVLLLHEGRVVASSFPLCRLHPDRLGTLDLWLLRGHHLFAGEPSLEYWAIGSDFLSRAEPGSSWYERVRGMGILKVREKQ